MTTEPEQKPIASLSLDLDNEWSYLRVHGDEAWQSFPSYLDVVVPRVLKFLAEKKLTITFFVVGQDAALEKNHEAIFSLAAAGHEIGNHSFNHEPWLHLYSEGEIEIELARTEEAIEKVTGYETVGFRGPGFSLSKTVLQILKRRGYEYDASTFPTFLGPLARAYYFMTTKLSEEEKERRNQLFGTFSEGFRPLKPYQWNLGAERLIEIPVTTLPLFKVPIHASYLLYLSSFSSTAASLYWETALRFCQFTGTELSLLLHPLDFLGADDVQSLSFFPAMKMGSQAKLERMNEYLALMASKFDIHPMREHAKIASSRGDLPVVEPRFVAPE